MKKVRVYLDNCCFNRPFDDQTQQKIYIETEAKLFIQRKVKDGLLKLTWSYILDYENSENPDEETRLSIQKWEKISDKFIQETSDILSNAIQFNKIGFGIKDSIHLACAIESESKYFITVDSGILKKRQLIKDITIMNPLEFISLEEEK